VCVNTMCYAECCKYSFLTEQQPELFLMGFLLFLCGRRILYCTGTPHSIRCSYAVLVYISYKYSVAAHTLLCKTGSLSTYFAVQYDATVQSSKGLQYSCSAYTVQTVRSTGTRVLHCFILSPRLTFRDLRLGYCVQVCIYTGDYMLLVSITPFVWHCL